VRESQVKMVVHGTYEDCLPSILKSGLSRMKRNHIHFAQGHIEDVKSGKNQHGRVIEYWLMNINTFCRI